VEDESKVCKSCYIITNRKLGHRYDDEKKKGVGNECDLIVVPISSKDRLYKEDGKER